jgi:hypothetical protein
LSTTIDKQATRGARPPRVAVADHVYVNDNGLEH